MRPVFIGGAVRSGTTMLTDLLGCHPRVTPIYETDFVIGALRDIASRADGNVEEKLRATMRQYIDRMPTLGEKRQPYERFVHGKHHLRFEVDELLHETEGLIGRVLADPTRATHAFRDFVIRVFRHHLKRTVAVRWVNKTPANVHFSLGLRAAFPEMLLVHIVRDGRDVTASALPLEFGPTSVEQGAKLWVGTLQLADQFRERHPDQYLEVRYEDLLQRPHDTVAGVLAAMDERLPSTLVEDWVQAVGALDTSRIGAHRAVFSDEDLARFEDIAGPTLERCGYERQLAPA